MMKWEEEYFEEKKKQLLIDPDSQMIVAIEELSELQKELCKFMRGEINREQIVNEVADVQVIMSDILTLFNIDVEELFDRMEYKMKRYLGKVK